MTNKSKNIFALLGFVVVIIMAYHLAIKKTIELKQEHDKLSQESELLKNIPRQLSILKQKESYYDSVLSKYHLQGTSIQTNLLKTINAYATDNDLKVIDFLEPHAIKTENLTVKTYLFTLEGDYSAIVKLIHKLEQETKFGEIINLHFEKKKNFRSGKDFLQAHVMIRNFG